ncbi:MAG TPA: short chain dehydrogenase, partial [Gammaproteobacteria bacterium]|nr:short chain dehydrogenase [Gammaproteobacteria bacterium]
MVLDDKVIVITGGAQGLGLATALRLAPKRPHIALIDMSQHKLAEAKNATESAGGSVSVWECDISEEEAVDEVFTQIAKQNGRLDAVVNNAGVTRDALLLKVKEGEVEKRMSLKDWQQVVDVNLTGTFLCGRAAATEMVKAGSGGCIINISSISRHGNMGQTN